VETSNRTGFAALGVPDQLVDALRARGIEQPFPIQSITIPDAMAGRDVCGKAKTGSGKTLAFGLPVLAKLDKSPPRRPGAIVLVPTRELAVQVTEELSPLAASMDRTVVAIYGGARIEGQRRELDEGADLVVVTPGRMIDLLQQGDVSVEDIGTVIIDEADRMADMGFLPQVEWILRQIGGPHQTLLFSATLDGVVDSLIKRYQRDPVMHEVESATVTVENMVHHFFQVHQLDKVKVAAACARTGARTIMFTRTKFGADRLARDLEKEGLRAAAIHGDLRQAHREKSLADFMAGKLPVLVATDVAARGLHIDDVDLVVHFDPPQDHKTYLHRSGRTARAGESGIVVTLVLWDQELEVRRMQKRLGIVQPIVEVFSNDKRLAELATWQPTVG
jgi:superfamily II DNA/RNA helicase